MRPAAAGGQRVVNFHASRRTKPFILRAVERPVKERLVGAAVLMAAAVILIPEMLSGPDRGSTEKSAGTAEGGVKTYTIDLSQSPGVTTAASAAPTADNRAPPPEAMPSTSAPPAEERAPEPQASTDQTSTDQTSTEETSSAQTSPESSPRTATEPPAESSLAPPATALPQPKPEPPPARAEAAPPAHPEPRHQVKPEAPSRPVASAPTAPRSSAPAAKPTGNFVPAQKGWAVQLGSYSSESTAQRLSSEWRAKGQSAFVMPVKSGGKTLYRVRLGLSKDRAGAEAILKSVKASVPGAAVVTHP